ncbi:MAG: CAP domain-containing protein [Polyangiaceae bacterium]
MNVSSRLLGAWLGVAGLATVGGIARADDDVSWPTTTRSPVATRPETLTDSETELVASCGRGDDRLVSVARAVVDRKLKGLPHLDVDGLSPIQRELGEPHVWPRVWMVSGRALEQETAKKKLDEWKGSFRVQGVRRCGVASATAKDGTRHVAAVAVDALADLAPLPVRGRTGEWLTLDAHLLVPATGAHVVVMGPSGAPYTVPTSFEKGRVRARFVLDRPGRFTVQVLAHVVSGPRPVLEANTFADVEPESETNVAAPGEDIDRGKVDAAGHLLRMVNEVRTREGLAPLERDRRLDVVAARHASKMKARREVGHDVGDGDPMRRLDAAGLSAKLAGENVAHASNVALAHRALYASPSHRTNLLKKSFDGAGIAVLEDADGSVWVTEMFAQDLE